VAKGNRQIAEYFGVMQARLDTALGSSLAMDHPVAKGDEHEVNWAKMLDEILPKRYQVDKAFVIDHTGASSDEIDLVIFDRQYSPLVMKAESRLYVPAEAVYAALEVKQELNAAHVNYAGEKVRSVRRLARTSASFVDARGLITKPREPEPVLGGLLTARCDWVKQPPKNLKKALAKHDTDQRLDLGCTLESFGWAWTGTGSTGELAYGTREQALVWFVLRLMAKLQTFGTVPALDYRIWGQSLR